MPKLADFVSISSKVVRPTQRRNFDKFRYPGCARRQFFFGGFLLWQSTARIMKTVLVSLVIGLVAGCTAALCGVGGGLIMVPAFKYLLGLDQKQAIATSLAIIIPTAILTTAKYAKAGGLIDWRIVACTVVGACLAAWFAADWMRTLSNPSLTKGFAILLIVSGVLMLWAEGK